MKIVVVANSSRSAIDGTSGDIETVNRARISIVDVFKRVVADYRSGVNCLPLVKFKELIFGGRCISACA